MPSAIGLVLSAAVAVFARVVGFDRDRAFYPTVMIVIASYYVLFAAMSGSVQTVVIESVVNLDFLPSNVHVTATDVTPAMLRQLERRAAGTGRSVTTRVMDARQPAFADASFDAVVMHLILAVMPEPERGVMEAVRVLKPGGRIAVFDKFLREGERPSLRRRVLNAFAKPLFSDLNRRLAPLIRATPLVIEHDAPAGFGGTYRAVTLVKPAQ